MTSGQKTALSLLISTILFGAFAVAAFAGLFSAIDARFYEPAKISAIQKNLKDICQSHDEYLKALNERFALGEGAFLKNPAVKSYVESRPSQEDVLSRSESLGSLRAATQGFLGLRVLDKNQNSLHFSTFRADVLRRDEKNNLTAYKNYSDCQTPSGQKEIPAQALSFQDAQAVPGAARVHYDAEDRIVFAYPIWDKYSVFRGTALFYVNASGFSNFLLKRALISIGQSAAFFSNGLEGDDNVSGYVFGLPSVGSDALLSEFKAGLLNAWKNNSSGAERLFAIEDGEEGAAKDRNYWVALSERSASGVFASGIYNDEIFSLAPSARLLILACVFVTLFLTAFLLLNVRRDDETVIRERIKALQLGVVDEYLSKKESLDWETISGRREAVTKEIIQSLGRRAKKRPEQVEALINRSWDELFAAMNLRPNGGKEGGGLENAQEIKAMLQEILSSGAVRIQAAPPSASSSPVSKPASPRPASAKPLPASAEPVEELEDVAPLESVDGHENDAPAVLESPLEAQPVEDLEEVDAAEPVEDLEEVDAAEPVEDLEEVDAAEPVEELEEIEEAEPVEELEELEDVAPLESVDGHENDAPAVLESPLEAQPVEDLEEVDAAEPVEELEEIEEAEPIEEAASAVEPRRDDVLSLLSSDEDKERSPDESISEDIASDFFALHEKRETESHSQDASRDESLDHFFTIRDAFAPDAETEELVKNFSIVEPSFRGLDARNEEQTLNGTFEEDKKNLVKELSPEDFGIQETKKKEEFSEELAFGAPQAQGHDDGFDVAATFTTENPRFERSPIKAVFKEASAPQKSAVQDEAAQAEAAIPLSNKESFMFTSFGQSAKVAELAAADREAITQGADGVFSISGDLETSGFVQDNSFKRLVDSVLQNS